jgi:signal transduction histidine kinase
LQVEELSVDELVQACASELQPLFAARRVEIIRSATVKDGLLEVRADPRLLRQALLNLLRNAAEAISDNQTERRVVIETSRKTEEGRPWAAISISDTGGGVAASDLQKIFIPFFTTKSHGHGIGLALAHRVITEHGGTLTAANNADGGATFTIRLPLAS